MIEYWKARRKAFKQLHNFRRPDERVRARLVDDSHGRKALLVGERKILTTRVDGPPPEHDISDYAMPALAAISMSNNIEIDVEFACSKDMATRIKELKNAYRLWSVASLAPLRINISITETQNTRNSHNRIICLSGGLDSMSAAIEGSENSRITHALLVAGADYASSKDIGFIELRQRVNTISEKLGLELLIVETDLSRTGFDWEMLHSFSFAHCLHYMSYAGF